MNTLNQDQCLQSASSAPRMNQPTHTPGPWLAIRIGNECYIEADGLLICNMNRNECPGELEVYHCDANARLISAAPDLLAALKLATEELDIAANYLCDLNVQAAVNCKQRAIEARSAVAKAEGKL